MGKSAYLFTRSSAESMRAQLRNMKDYIGRGLRLDGPFADKDGAVEEIADSVRTLSNMLGWIDIRDLTMLTLLPQDRLPKGCPPSMLEVPFMIGNAESGWRRFSESAGEVASRAAVETDKGLFRPAEITELTMLTISVLRKLGRECHFSMYNFKNEKRPGKDSDNGTAYAGVIVPSIVTEDGRVPTVSLLMPEGMNIFSDSMIAAAEVLDGDALLAHIKLNNAYYHAQALMRDIAKRNPESETRRALSAMHRSIDIGHMLFDSLSLWTLSQAQADLKNAKSVFGPDNEWLRSFREIIVQGTLQLLTNPSHNATVAASAMLPEEIRKKLYEYSDGSIQVLSFPEFLDSIDHPSVPLYKEYLESTPIVINHVHPVSECRTGGSTN